MKPSNCKRHPKPYWLAVEYNDGTVSVHNHYTADAAQIEAEHLMLIDNIKRVSLADRAARRVVMQWEIG